MQYQCLVLDHDDTVVQSTDQIHFPSFQRVLAQVRPEVHWTLEDYLRYNFDPGFLPTIRDILHFTPEEIEWETAIWQQDVAAQVPAAFPGIAGLLRRFQAAGGKICVVSHSFRDTILRDYRENGLPLPDQIFGWELPKDQVKPSPYALDQIMDTYSLRPQDLVVVDDLKPGLDMARCRGVDFLAAGWAYDVPEITAYFRQQGLPILQTVEALSSRLFP